MINLSLKQRFFFSPFLCVLLADTQISSRAVQYDKNKFSVKDMCVLSNTHSINGTADNRTYKDKRLFFTEND